MFSFVQSSNVEWLKHNTVEFSNFNFIDKAVREKQFIFIGESSHGANEFYSFKVALTEYLIKKHGFEVVAVESPLIASYFYDNLVATRLDSLSHAEHILFPIFCNNTTKEFIDTLDKWNIPIVGFDNQLGTTYQARNVTQFVYSKMIRIDSVIANEFLEINPLFSKDNIVRFSKDEEWYNYPCAVIKDSLTCEYWLNKYNKFVHLLESHYSQLLSICEYDSIATFATIRAVQTVQIDLITKIHHNDLAVRDSLMAKNIEFIVSKMYPKKKVIFWAHNAHVAKHYNSVNGHFNGDHRTMVGFLGKRIIDQSLVIGLYGIQGATNLNNRTVSKMKAVDIDSTLEFQVKDKIDKQAYIDLKKYPGTKNEKPIYLCHWGIYPESMSPGEQYDFLVFIKNITPSTYLEAQ